MWPFNESKEDELYRETLQLKNKLLNAEFDLLRVSRELADARISGAKVRSRALRLERRRLRALLDQHSIPWAHPRE
jgi:hypothetical protein